MWLQSSSERGYQCNHYHCYYTMMLQKGLDNNNPMLPSPQTAHFHLLHNIMGHLSVVKIVVISSRHPAPSALLWQIVENNVASIFIREGVSMQPLPLLLRWCCKKVVTTIMQCRPPPKTAHFHLLNNIMGHSCVVKIVVISSRHPATSPVYPIEKCLLASFHDLMLCAAVTQSSLYIVLVSLVRSSAFLPTSSNLCRHSKSFSFLQKELLKVDIKVDFIWEL